MFQTKVIEKIKAHNLCTLAFFFFENRAVYEIMWTNTVKRGRPQVTVWLMSIACWIPKATNTHSNVSHIVFSLQKWLHEGASVLRYTYIACLVVLCVLFGMNHIFPFHLNA